jgi:hypothetical protein
VNTRDLQVDIWLRGTDFAETQVISGITVDPALWTDHDVAELLKAMLLALYRAKNRDACDTPVFLRGFSWIVNPFADGGVVLAVEIQIGAAVAGPFAIDKELFEEMISRAIARHASGTPSTSIH